MTRKHFQAIALTVRNVDLTAVPTADRARVRERIAKDFATVCAQYNANFNRSKFLAACIPSAE